LGGRAEGANIEVHDTVFAVAKDFDQAKLKAKSLWFGNKKRVHIDAYIQLEQIGEHKIEIEIKPNLFHHLSANQNNADNNLSLFYINFGASLPEVFCEFHESDFFVAPSQENAISQARKKLCLNYQNIHLDDNFVVDDCLKIDDLLQNYKINISHSLNQASSKPISCYIKL
jgi:hypothetical protein